jgi:3'(2'), 5'-bisphosphate nucleotidase
MDDAALLELAAGLASRAAAVIMAIRGEGFAVQQKADASPVTEADRAAERLITSGLRQATPDVPVVAEEEVAAGAPPPQAASFWLVDPLDGTRDFTAGLPNFTVNIGLVRNEQAVLGAVALPATGEVFAGIVGHGAWKEHAGVRRKITVRAPPSDGVTVMASRHYADDPQLAAFLAGLTVKRVFNIGSAVKFCRVAEGTADIYPRLGRTMEWDTAAPHAVLEAAGGSLTLLTGGNLRYGKPGWANPPFLCRGQ